MGNEPYRVKEIEFIGYALKRMKRRGISEKDVAGSIKSPDELLYDVLSRCHIAVKKTNDKHIIVTYTVTGNKVTVITTFKTSRGKYLILRKGRLGVWIKTE